jgi:hypothetical protein
MQYVFGGISPPILNAMFVAGQAIPVRFPLFAADHTIVSTAVANLQVFRLTSTGLVPVNVTSDGSSNTGTLFRYDPNAKQYVYTMSTKRYVPGSYLLRVVVNDGTIHDVPILIH